MEINSKCGWEVSSTYDSELDTYLPRKNINEKIKPLKKTKKIKTLSLPEEYINVVDSWVEEGRFPSRSYALRYIIHWGVKNLEKLGKKSRVITAHLYEEDINYLNKYHGSTSFCETLRILLRDWIYFREEED